MILGIVQARMGSTRLPGKVLADVAGKPLLARVLARIGKSTLVGEWLVATSSEAADDPIAAWCAENEVPFFRGSQHDVLDRYFQAARTRKPDAVVRITADCPLHDGAVIDSVVGAFLQSGGDYASNTSPATFPDGLDAEIFSYEALCCAHRLAVSPSEREHVTPYLRAHPELFRPASVTHSADLSGERWTVDLAADLELVRAVYGHFGDVPFSWHDVAALLREKPQWRSLNRPPSASQSQAAIPFRSELGLSLYNKAKKLIPGGTQLLSKRPEMFLPDQWPSYYSRAKGCEVWSLEGQRYVDFSINGIAACLLGFSDDEVNAAVTEAVSRGSNATLNCPEEVELAELLCELHPWAEMVRYARGGGEAMSMAVRIARAATGREAVAFCGYHGWPDWYLAANLSSDHALDGHLLPGLDPTGVPRSLVRTAFPFRANHLEELAEIVRTEGKRLAAIVIESPRGETPEPGFLEGVQRLANETGAVFIVDEITMGFRATLGGAHLLYGLKPDIAVFAKGMSNGFAMAAVIGRRQVMEAAQTSFISSTYWTERIGPTAALATIRKLRRHRVSDFLCETGRTIRDGWLERADAAGIPIRPGGSDPLPNFAFDYPAPIEAKTLFTQEMLDRGYLASPVLCVTWAHKPEVVQAYLETVGKVFLSMAPALEAKAVRERLRGPVAHSGFQRLTH